MFPKLHARQVWIACALLVILGLIAYANSYAGAFVYDDTMCLVEKGGIDQWWPAQEAQFTTGMRRWLTHLTFVANYKLHGHWLPGYHLVNNAIHIGAALALFGLVRRALLLPATRDRYEHSAVWIAFAAAAIWLVHPLQTESVTYIVQRLESLAGCLFLLTLYLVLRGSQSPWRFAWYSAAVAVVWIGTGSKETMYLTPLAVLLMDRCYLASSWRELWRERWGLYAGMFPALIVSGWMLKGSFTPGTKSAMGFGFQAITPWEYLRTQPSVILHYLSLSFWPARQCVDYGWPVESDPWRIYLPGAIIVLLVIATAALLWWRPKLGAIAALFFLTLAPTSSFMPIRDLAFEHRMYLALASVVILTVLAVYETCRRILAKPTPRFAIPAMLLVLALVALTWRTHERNRIYHDPVLVWHEVATRSPNHARGAYNLGEFLSHRAMLADNRAFYYHLLTNDPVGLRKLVNREGMIELKGDFADSIQWFEYASRLDPKWASPYFNLGGLYDRAGKYDVASEYYRKTLKNDKRHLHARLNLVRILTDRGDFEEATKIVRKGIDLLPEQAKLYNAYGKLLAQQGEHEAAIVQFEQALSRQPDMPSPRQRTAVSLWALGRQREAITVLRKLRKERGTLTDVNLTLARYLIETHERDLRDPIAATAIAQQVIAGMKEPTAEAKEVLALCEEALQTQTTPVTTQPAE